MSSKQLTNRESAYLCRSLSGLLHAGISIAEGCHLLSQEDSRESSRLLSGLQGAMDEGDTFSDALERFSCFPASTVGLIRTGEYAGKLEEALLSCAHFHETQERTQRQLKNALGYPLILLCLMLMVIGVLLVQVLPVFDSVYASLGTRLSGIAAGLLYLGRALKQSLPVLAVLAIVLTAACILVFRVPSVSASVTAQLAKPGDDRGIRRKFNNALFAQALAMGISSGLTPEEAIRLGQQLLKDSPAAAKRCESCLEAICQGSDLSAALSKGQLLSPSACRMVSVGLRGGSADRILEDIAQQMQEDAEQALQDRISKIEPALVLTASILVGAIILSVMLPLMQILTALG